MGHVSEDCTCNCKNATETARTRRRLQERDGDCRTVSLTAFLHCLVRRGEGSGLRPQVGIPSVTAHQKLRIVVAGWSLHRRDSGFDGTRESAYLVGGLFGDFESFLPFLVNFGSFLGLIFPFLAFFGVRETVYSHARVEAVLSVIRTSLLSRTSVRNRCQKNWFWEH
jgi:hypothetical protein